MPQQKTSFSVRLTVMLFILCGAAICQRRPTTMFNGHEVVASRVLIQFDHTLSSSERAELTRSLDLSDLRGVGGTGALLFDSRSLGTDQMIAALSQRLGIVYVEPDPVRHATQAPVLPNDPYFPQQWALSNTGQTVNGVTGIAGADIRALGAWQWSTGGKNVAIGVIDSGIDYTHPDLVANMWVAPQSFTINIGGNVYVCSAGTHGFSAVSGYSGCDPYDSDVYGHGTAVAGIIGAAGNNGQGTTGVNWTSSMISLRSTDSAGITYGSDDASAMEAGIQIKQQFGGAANIRAFTFSSSGSSSSQTEINEINKAGTFGIVFVAATGNDCSSGASYPARLYLANEIAVSASDQNDQRAVWNSTECSNGGGEIAAPGKNNWTTQRYGGYQLFAGTSAATPFVSGAITLVASMCTLPYNKLMGVIEANADLIPALTSISTNGRRLNVAAAIQSCAVGTPGTAQVNISGTGCFVGCGWGQQNNPDSGLVNVTIEENQYFYKYSAALDTSATIAQALTNSINSDPFGTVSAQITASSQSAATISLTTKALGPFTNFGLNTAVVDQCVSNPPYSACSPNPFAISGSGFTAGHN